MLTDDQKIELISTLEAEMIEEVGPLDMSHEELVSHTKSKDINDLVENDLLKDLVIDMLNDCGALDNLIADVLGMAQHHLLEDLKNV